MNKAVDSQRDELLYKRWLAELPIRMTSEENYMTFDEFKERLTPKKILGDDEQIDILNNAYKLKEMIIDGNI